MPRPEDRGVVVALEEIQLLLERHEQAPAQHEQHEGEGESGRDRGGLECAEAATDEQHCGDEPLHDRPEHTLRLR